MSKLIGHRGRGGVTRAGKLLAGTAPVAVLAMGLSSVFAVPQAFAIDEIIVTAQKRKQAIVDVPVAVTAIGSDLLESANIEDLDALENFVPGFNRSGNSIPRFARTHIRGVGSLQIASASDSSIGFYVDGVAVPRFAQGARLFDIERIEVLKGPQGTLYGRSAQAGVVNITTKRPSDVLEIGGSIETGSRDLLDVLGTVSAPLNETVAVRLGAAYKEQDGFLDNPVTPALDGGVENQNVAAGLTVRPNNWIEADIGFQYLTEDTNYPTQGAFLRGSERVFGQDTSSNEMTGYRAYATVNLDFDAFTLTSATGYYSVENSLFSDDTDFFDVEVFLPSVLANDPTIDFSDWFDEESEISQELRVQGVTQGGIDWLVGANLFFNDYEGEFVNNDFFAGGGILDGVRDHTIERTGYAVFADASFPLTSVFTVSAGLRYSFVEQDLALVYTPLNGNFPAEGGTQLPLFEDRQSENYDAISGRLAVTAALTDGTNVYASYSRGFKPGAFPVFDLGSAIGVPLTPLDETKINAYEIGLKTVSEDGRFGAALAVFFNDVRDEQVASTSPLNPLVLIFENTDVESFGVELEATLQPIDGLQILANAAYIGSEIKTATTNFTAGTEFPRVPDFSGGVSVAYTFAQAVPGLGLDITPRVDYAYVGQRTFPSAVSPTNIGTLDAYSLVNASVTFSVKRFALTVGGENIFDKDYALSGGAGFFEEKFFFGDERQWFLKLRAAI